MGSKVLGLLINKIGLALVADGCDLYLIKTCLTKILVRKQPPAAISDRVRGEEDTGACGEHQYKMGK